MFKLSKKQVIGLVVIAVVVLVAVLEWPSPKAVPQTRLITYLQTQNDSLTSANTLLVQENVLIAQDRDKALHVGDSLKVVSDAATSTLRRARTTIPSALPATDTDTTSRRLYATVVAQLDSAITQLGVKDQIIAQDSIARVKQDQIAANDALRIVNLTSQLANAYTVAQNWHDQYDALNKEHHPRCGRKCGMVLGALAVVGTAVAVHKVQDALPQHRTDLITVRIGAF